MSNCGVNDGLMWLIPGMQVNIRELNPFYNC